MAFDYEYNVFYCRLVTEDESASSGYYCCTDHGVFEKTDNVVNLHGYTWGVMGLSIRPVSFNTSVIGISPIPEETYDKM